MRMAGGCRLILEDLMMGGGDTADTVTRHAAGVHNDCQTGHYTITPALQYIFPCKTFILSI